AVSGAARERLYRPRGRRNAAGPHDADAVRDQPGRRGARRGHPLGDAGSGVRAHLARPVCDGAVRLGEFLSQGPEGARGAPVPWAARIMQFFIAVYGGNFGGGIGLLMMAALTMTDVEVRNAGAAKNILAGVMNASAVAIFVF